MLPVLLPDICASYLESESRSTCMYLGVLNKSVVGHVDYWYGTQGDQVEAASTAVIRRRLPQRQRRQHIALHPSPK